jgi:hypothetical protein
MKRGDFSPLVGVREIPRQTLNQSKRCFTVGRLRYPQDGKGKARFDFAISVGHHISADTKGPLGNIQRPSGLKIHNSRMQPAPVN